MEHGKKQNAESAAESLNKPALFFQVGETKLFATGLAIGVVAREAMLNFVFGECYRDEWWVTAIIAALVACFGGIPYYLTRRILKKGVCGNVVYPFISGIFLGFSTMTIFWSYLDLQFALPLLLLFSIVLSIANSLKVMTRFLAYAALALSTILVLTLMLRLDNFKMRYTIECVRFVYWKNFCRTINGERPFPDLQSLSGHRLQLWLHGIGGLKTDPWGNPFQYELVANQSVQHPHRGQFKLDYAFWSTGADGKDDGHQKKDDIDITNAEIFGHRD